MDKFTFNLCAGIHNLGLVEDAQRLINNFLRDGEGIVYVVNPDGTTMELQKGVKFIGVDITIDVNEE